MSIYVLQELSYGFVFYFTINRQFYLSIEIFYNDKQELLIDEGRN